MKDCGVCVIVKSDTAEVILEDTEHWRVALSPDQEFLGRTFITLRQHKESLSELNDQEWRELAEISRQLESAVKTAFAPTHFNWSCLMNDAAVSETSSHVHWHFHPRYKAPVEFAGRTFIDTRWPQSARTLNPHVVSEGTLQEIKKAIAAELKK